MEAFTYRLKARLAEHGPLCIGIDPSASLLKSCGLPDTAEGALEFGLRLLRAADYRLPIVKPQSAYFERHGSAGIKALEELGAECRSREVLFLMDAKRGDIDATAEAYAEAYFSPSSPLRADALTLNPYLGLGALEKAMAYAVKHHGGLFVVVRSSNPEGEALQTARLADGRSVAQALCQDITRCNSQLAGEGLGPVGAVVGATCEDAAATVDALPTSFILAPGVGAQGATFEDILRRMPKARGRVLANVSRGVLANGAEPAALRTTISAMKEAARVLL